MIRSATLQDYDRVMEMMINFANHSPWAPHHDPQYNDHYVRNLLSSFIANGCILVAEPQPNQLDQTPQLGGMLIATTVSDPWLPHVKTLKELAWWVEPEYRQTSMGYRLLQKYIEVGKKMVTKGYVDGFTLTNMSISPDFDLEKRGWQKVETNYIYGDV